MSDSTRPRQQTRPRFGLFVILSALAGSLASPAGAQEAASFVIGLGEDTVAVERFTRTADRLEGRMVLRTPRVQIREYSAALAPDGSVTSFELRYQDPGADPREVARVEYSEGGATMYITQDDSIRTVEISEVSGAGPFVPSSIALYEPALAAFRQAGSEPLERQMLVLGADRKLDLSIEPTSTDEVRLTNIAGPSRVRVDPDGRILEWDGSESTLKLLAERGGALDIDGLAARFAAREASAGPLGTLSPGDSVHATVGDAALAVHYSRPSARGRDIFGGVVPWNEVWRTGANAATRFSTDRDIRIAGEHVPAGEYTLWTVPAPDGWTLIVNRQTGQWGTDYDESQDLVRVPMQVESLPAPVERFTIDIADRELSMSWDRTRAFVPIEVP